VDERVLGRLLSALVVLEALPTEARIREFLQETIADVPGIAECEILLDDPEAPPGQMRPSGVGKGLTLTLESEGSIYGALVLEIEDEDAFSRYRPFLSNLAASLALLLENRRREGRLQKTLSRLAASEERYRSLFESMLNGYAYCQMLYDKQEQPVDFLFLAVNPAFEKLTGLKDVVDKLVTEVIPIVKETNPEVLEAYGRVAQTGRPEQFELDLKPLGMVLWVSVYSPARGYFVSMFENITERRQAEEALGRAYDDLELRVRERTAELTVANATAQAEITERKQVEHARRESEARYRLLFEAANDAIFVHDDKARILAVNPLTAQRLGYTLSELESMNVGQLDTPEEAQHVSERVARLMEQGSLTFETVHQRKDGSPVPTEVSARRITWDGQPAMLSICRDITERKAAEKALRQSDEQLRQSQKMEAVGQLAGGIAHDFNNLLTAILSYSDMILANGSSTVEEVRPDIEEIKRAGERASALTRQILAFSRRQALRPQVVLLDDIVRGIEPLLRRSIGEDTDLEIRESPGLAPVEVDPHQFEQVVMNLVINARDAMPSGGRLIMETTNAELDEEFSRTHAGARPGSYGLLRVTDTGVGMDDNVKDHMFEPFFTTKASGAGTGLGLATVHGIVKQSGGNIFVTSEPGRGTSVDVYLPRAAQAEVPEGILTPPHVSARGSETIMVVEDEKALQVLVERILGASGYTTLIFSSAPEALAALEHQKSPIDLLLTDVMLPGLIQGHDLARTILVLRPHLPVLYISGYSRDALVHAGRLDEGVNLLEKPFSPKSLTDMVRTVLDMPRGPG